MNIRKTVLSAVIAGVGFTGMAHAGSLSGTGSSQTIDVVFAAQSEVINTLAPVTGLEAGITPGNTIIASGTMTTRDGSAQRYAFVVDGNQVANGSGNGRYSIVKGTNNPANEIRVYAALNDATSTSSWQAIDDKSYRVLDNAVSTVNYLVRTWPEQLTVAPDTYSITTIAYLYNE